MKLALFFFLAIALTAVLAQTNGLTVDTYNFESDRETSSTLFNLDVDDSFISGTRYTYIRRFAASAAADDLVVQVDTGNARASISVGASSDGQVTFAYNGANAQISGNTAPPCGLGRWLNDCDDSALANLPGDGLDLDVSGFSGLAFVVRTQDKSLAAIYAIRVLYADGVVGYAQIVLDRFVESTSNKPVIYFPLTSLRQDQSRDVRIKTILVGVSNNQGEALDASIGPAQFTGVTVTKTASASTAVVSDEITFDIEIVNSVFTNRVGNVVTTDGFTSTVDVIDTLPTGLDFVAGSLTVNNVAASNNLQVGQRTFNLNFDINDGQQISVSYRVRVADTINQCGVTLCNNADLTSTTTAVVQTGFSSLDSNGQIVEQTNPGVVRQFNEMECVTVSSTNVFEFGSFSCPSFENNVATYQLCNRGNGPTDLITFTQADNAVCGISTVNGIPITCPEGICTANIASIPSNTCADVVVQYACSLTNTCEPTSVTIAPQFVTTCGNIQIQQTCSFTNTPALGFAISEIIVNTEPAKPEETVTFQITYNTVSSIMASQGAVLSKVYGPNVTPSASTLQVWNCPADNSRTCTFAVNTLSQTPQTIQFSVDVNADFPVTSTQTCNTATISSAAAASLSCRATASDNACAAVNPGSPNVSIEKFAFSSQYVFDITYSSVGAAPVTNLVLHEVLQAGWVLSDVSSAAGWVCESKQCSRDITGSLAAGTLAASGTVQFIVDIFPESESVQLDNTKCWENIVTASFDNDEIDPTPLNNVASAKIGSSCQQCCEVTCPEQPEPIVVACPTVATCNFEIPQYYCPPCQVDPAACVCQENCATTTTK